MAGIEKIVLILDFLAEKILDFPCCIQVALCGSFTDGNHTTRHLHSAAVVSVLCRSDLFLLAAVVYTHIIARPCLLHLGLPHKQHKQVA